MDKPTVLLLGKLPPPYMGPAIATQILLNSGLNDHYRLLHVNTNVHESLHTLGVWSLRKVFQNFRVYRDLIRVLYREKPDLVLIPISQTTIGFLKDSLFIWLCRLFRRKILLQLRGSGFKDWVSATSPLTRRYVRSVLAQARGVIVLGENLRHLFEDFFRPDRIFVVPNGADYPVFEEEAGSKGDTVNVLYLANLQPTKGIEDVIRAVGVLKDRGLNHYQLNVVGNWLDEKTQATCERLVEEKDLPVTFHGPAYGADKYKYMQQADVFIFTPRAPEGHPWVIVEAMAAGLPIISTDQGAIVESVRDGVNGFIVDAQSPAQIADRMQQLIGQPALRKKMAQESLRHYRNHFTEEKMVVRMQTTFNILLRMA